MDEHEQTDIVLYNLKTCVNSSTETNNNHTLNASITKKQLLPDTNI